MGLEDRQDSFVSSIDGSLASRLLIYMRQVCTSAEVSHGGSAILLASVSDCAG